MCSSLSQTAGFATDDTQAAKLWFVFVCVRSHLQLRRHLTIIDTRRGTHTNTHTHLPIKSNKSMRPGHPVREWGVRSDSVTVSHRWTGSDYKHTAGRHRTHNGAVDLMVLIIFYSVCV